MAYIPFTEEEKLPDATLNCDAEKVAEMIEQVLDENTQKQDLRTI